MLRRLLAVVLGCAGVACAQLSGLADLSVRDNENAAAPGDAAVGGGDASTLGDGAIRGPDGGSIETPVFFLQGTGEGTSLVAAPALFAQGKVREIGCASPAAALFEYVPTGGQSRNGPFRLGNLTMRSFAGTATQRPRFVFGNEQGGLLLADEGSACPSSPPKALGLGTQNGAGLFPRFSPDGLRVVYVETLENDIVAVVTVGIDGSAPRRIKEAASLAPGGLWLSAPMWISNTELVWVERGGSIQSPLPLRVQRGLDVPASAPAQTVSCNRFVEQLERLPDGKIVRVGSVQSALQTKSTITISVHDDLASSCTTGRTLASASGANAARDVALSPTGALAAFAWNVEADANVDAGERTLESPMHLWLVSTTDPSATPTLCSAQDADTDDFGPQFINDGTQIVWMHSPHKVLQESLYVADVVAGRCTNVRPLLPSTNGATRTMFGANAGSSCEMARGVPKGSLLGWSVVAMLLAGARRRSRRERGG